MRCLPGLRNAGIEPQILRTADRGQATELAAAGGAGRTVIAVGGDGTANEVINGLMELPGKPPETIFGALMSGTGSDLARSLPVPRSPGDVVRWLRSDRTRLIDLGCFRGKEGSRFFINAADVGIGAEVVRRQEDMPRKLGSASFLLASLISLARYRSRPLSIALDGRNPRAVKAWTVAIANGSCFGGGMKIAPAAKLDDGLLDVVTVGSLGRLKAVVCLPLLYAGHHDRLSEVRIEKAGLVLIDSPMTLEVETDGELAGFTPATFEILPRALQVIDWER